MKKIASLILVLCLGLSLFGCGGGDKPAATDGGQPADKQQMEQQKVEFREYKADANGKEAIYIVDQEVSPEEVQAFLEEKAKGLLQKGISIPACSSPFCCKTVRHCGILHC